ncbi:hypothetical protein HT102_00270 [Hoyosella sp. G463]|uniref:Uncharacterized protein n=1 Tax=Lolliginicoccus lacisalsi TaxID=2742202 RepID=A0A927PL03_9ACTN|nr:hypothetical protein [Lolliginicoccus lacisalsi]MBD8504921.1 hypothetical protein [Lolliginicoccus lacisalsi]
MRDDPGWCYHGERGPHGPVADATRWVLAWAASRRLPPPIPPLADGPALFLAAGHLRPATREAYIQRLRSGASIPSVGGFARLRQAHDLRSALATRAAALPPGPARLVLRRQAGSLELQIQEARARFTLSRGHYPTSVREVRRERKEGTYLGIEQRDEVFDALLATPAPMLADRTARAMLVQQAHKLERSARWQRLARAVGDRLDVDATDDRRFADEAEVMLHLAGVACAGIGSSAAWRSATLKPLRAQLDLVGELTAISVDAIAAAGLREDLADSLVTARTAAERAEHRARARQLAPIWQEIAARTAALLDIDETLRAGRMPGTADGDLLDARLEEIAGRAGDRELSAAGLRRVSDQVGQLAPSTVDYHRMLFGRDAPPAR